MMSWLFEIAARIRSLFAGSRMERELEEEITTHIDMLTQENIRRGLAPETARREALLKVGNRGVLREVHLEARSFRPLEDLLRDIRYSLRLFRSSPLFTLVAAVSLIAN